MLEIIGVLKPGGRLVSLEFGVPPNPVARALWRVYTRGVLPMAGPLVSRGWRQVGGFLGPSISNLHQSYTEGGVRELWLRLGILDVQVKRLSLGGAVVMWGAKGGLIETVGTTGRQGRNRMATGERPAFYALPGAKGWQDYLNLLHVPYTLWHMGYVVLGATIAPTVHLDRLLG